MPGNQAESVTLVDPLPGTSNLESLPGWLAKSGARGISTRGRGHERRARAGVSHRLSV
jgi:hypothetical protein